MANIVRGYIMSMLESIVVRPKMMAAVEHVRATVDPASTRELLHADALEGLATGNTNKAAAAWEAILAEYPHDLLALKMHHHSTFWTGRSYVIRNTVAGVFDAWDASIPGYSFVLGMMCFGLEECGDYVSMRGSHCSIAIRRNGRTATRSRATTGGILRCSGSRKAITISS